MTRFVSLPAPCMVPASSFTVASFRVHSVALGTRLPMVTGSADRECAAEATGALA